MTNAEYSGRRILEAMHEAVHYTQAVSDLIEEAWPETARQVLEFGAGDGAFVKQFRGKGADVDCVEIDTQLRTSLHQLGGRVYGDIREVASESYDFIYSVNVLEHIHDLESEVKELRRVLRPGGVLFVFVPAFRMLWTSLDTEVGHVTRFTRSGLVTTLEHGGFGVQRVAYFDSLGFPAALTVRLLEKFRAFSYGGGTVGFYDSYVFPLSRILDAGFQHFLGKNLIAFATKA